MTGKAALCGGALLLAAIGGAGIAEADTFDFSYSGFGGFGSIQAMGTLTATLQPSGNYLISGITGERNGATITALLATGTATGENGKNDNVLIFPAKPGYLDSDGFIYKAGGTNYNVFYNNQGSYYEDNTSNGATPELTSFNVTPHNSPAPVPGGGLLSFLAFGLAGLAWRRKAIVGLYRSALAKLEARLSPAD